MAGFKINSLYAWVATGTGGDEGIVGGVLPGMQGPTPFVGADRERIEGYRSAAEDVANLTGSPVKLKMFSGGVVRDEIAPAIVEKPADSDDDRPDDDRPSLGPCCVCLGEKNVRTFVMLPAH